MSVSSPIKRMINQDEPQNHPTKRSKGGGALVNDVYQYEDCFIDKEDFAVVCEILPDSHRYYSSFCRGGCDYIKRDDDHRVCGINVENTWLERVPYSIGKLKNLAELKLNPDIQSLPSCIAQLENLTRLHTPVIPPFFCQLKNLRHLVLFCPIRGVLPEAIGSLSSLRTFKLSKARGGTMDNSITIILPTSMGQLQNLQYLEMSEIVLDKLPDEIGNLVSLQNLVLRDSSLNCSIPKSVGRLQNLQCLDLTRIGMYRCSLENELVLPEEVGNLTNLKTLRLGAQASAYSEHARLTCLRTFVRKLQNLQELDLTHTEWEAFPDEILSLRNLRVLVLRSTDISSLPSSVSQLESLQRLDLSYSLLRQLPEEIGLLLNLKELDLERSCVEALPESLGNLENLNYLDLGYTEISSLPESVKRSKSLKYLNIVFCKKLFEGEDMDEFLMMLATSCKSLGSISTCTDFELLKGGGKQLRFELTCNRARFRLGMNTNDVPMVQLNQNLWPRLLQSARHAFQLYSDWHNYCSRFALGSPEAIYQILMIARESFVLLLVNSKKTDDARHQTV